MVIILVTTGNYIENPFLCQDKILFINNSNFITLAIRHFFYLQKFFIHKKPRATIRPRFQTFHILLKNYTRKLMISFKFYLIQEDSFLSVMSFFHITIGLAETCSKGCRFISCIQMGQIAKRLHTKDCNAFSSFLRV